MNASPFMPPQTFPVSRRVRKRATLTWQLQAGVHRGVLDHRRGVAAVVHVQLGALGLAVDHRQAQAEPLGVGLGPARETGSGGLWQETPAPLLHPFISHNAEAPSPSSGHTGGHLYKTHVGPGQSKGLKGGKPRCGRVSDSRSFWF